MGKIFEFTREHDGSLSLESAVGQAIGAASVCWENIDRAGVFQSDQAKIILDELVRFIKEETEYNQPNLGLATTAQLLDDIRARIEIDYYNGGGGLYYTSMHGRPESNLKED